MKKLLHQLLLLALFITATSQAVWADPNNKKASYTRKKLSSKKILYRKGSVYVLSSKNNIPVSYSRAYSKSGKTMFTTNYTVYNETKEPVCQIKAVHNRKDHSVEVSVKDLQNKGFPIVNVERTTYASPFMGRFGSIGKVGAVAKGKARGTAPGQLIVKFVSTKYDYINIVSVADAHEDSGRELRIYVLDEH